MRAVFEGGPKPVPPGHKSFKDSSFLMFIKEIRRIKWKEGR
jgi:hypothetical protein